MRKKLVMCIFILLITAIEPVFAEVQTDFSRTRIDYLYMVLMDDTAQWIETYDKDIWTLEQLKAQLEELHNAGCEWINETTEKLILECEQNDGSIEAERFFLYLFEDSLGSYDSWKIRDLYQFDLVMVRYGLKDDVTIELPDEEMLTEEEARSIALRYLMTRKDLQSVPISRKQLEDCEMDYKYLDKGKKVDWIVGFTLQEPIWDWRGFAVRVSAINGNVTEFTARYVQRKDEINAGK